MSRPAAYPPVDYFAYSSKSSQNDFNDLLGGDTRQRGQLASEQTRRDAINALLELEPRYREKNWDGQGADPIPEAAFQEARTFLLKLPATIPLPEVIAEPDGYLGLEWYANKWLLYVVSFSGKGAMSCSGLMGRERIYGTRYMDEGIPAEVLRNIARVLR